MSIRLGVTMLAATFLLGSASSLKAGGSAAAPHTTIAAPGEAAPARYADLFRQAPIGHRQPRPVDIPEATEATRGDDELRRLDTEIDRKLIICRGC
ncbi:hypothetical protein G8O24_15045 [Bradyrhizobium sp. INPA01-394B]|uniref:Uncharacterized protein n=1 Tax=Bradyrhizobium campsiandrae TaxID=1729892 RepID=A0ABR7UJH9_9BRAD|nr:hypothetical protein [Bradyrhizobium campsiandrae]MBC9878656.1 hypothetical protein [Bradyrhizobium campsiandrae]MBC9983323.1 hypothetical protein [Bradyrhizobium campsiandrae]